jgi:hypothetical protein
MFVAGIAAAVPAPALAEYFAGYGDTGWSFDNKRDCCDEAIALAQDHSMLLCENAGGHARVRSGSRRGNCESDARGNGRHRIYRCTARADVYCR